MGINFSSQTSRFKARSKPAQIVDVLRTIRERQKEGAVLVHCYHGADRTGLVAAKVANLNFSDVKIKFDDGIASIL